MLLTDSASRVELGRVLLVLLAGAYVVSLTTRHWFAARADV